MTKRERILDAWSSGAPAWRIAQDCDSTEQSVRSTVSVARKDGDPRATVRRRLNDAEREALRERVGKARAAKIAQRKEGGR
jgi:hypothetical protein